MIKEKNIVSKRNKENKLELEKIEEKKAENERISKLYHILSNRTDIIDLKNQYLTKSEKIKNCSSQFIQFYNRNNPKIIKSFTMRCQKRLCPTCIYFESKKTFKLINAIVSDRRMKGYQYLFITLTVRNCKAEELSKTIDLLLSAYNKLITNKQQQFAKRFDGIFRVLESTYNRNTREYHPHLHLLVAVKDEYFHDVKKYLTLDKLIEVWQKALNVDYKPSVKIKACYNTQSKAVAECAKYTVKSSEIVSADVLEIYDLSFSHRRLKSFSGIFYEIRKKIKSEWKNQKSEIDSLTYNDIIVNPDFVKIIYQWNYFRNQFILKKIDDDFNMLYLNPKQKNFITERLK